MNGGLHALAWLLMASGKNQVRRQVQRLREPRYALGIAFGILYFVLVLGIMAFGPPPENSPLSGLPSLAPLIPLPLMALIAYWWIKGGYQFALTLSPSETALLVPAPLTRRQLIQYKLLHSQAGLLFVTLILSILFGSKSLLWPLNFISMWVLITTFHFHQLAASLVHAGAIGQGGPGRKRFAVPVLLAIMVFAAVALSFSGVLDYIGSGESGKAIGVLLDNLRQPLPRLALYPVTALLNPLGVDNAGAWIAAMPGALVVLILHYWWLLRSDHAFEEAAMAAGQKYAALRAGNLQAVLRPRRQPAWRRWLVLRPVGRPAGAVVWKNIIHYFSLFRLEMMLFIMGTLVALAAFLTFLTDYTFAADQLAMISLAIVILLTLFGPFYIPVDLRSDLRSVELLMTFPIRGRDLVAAEIAAATIALFFIQLLVILFGLGALVLGSADATRIASVISQGGIALILVLPLNAVLLAVQNMFALFWPAWLLFGRQQPGGIEIMGRMLLLLLVTLLAGLVALLPAALCGVIVWAVLPGDELLAQGGAVLGVAAALMVELAAATIWLGNVYDNLDPVDAGLL